MKSLPALEPAVAPQNLVTVFRRLLPETFCALPHAYACVVNTIRPGSAMRGVLCLDFSFSHEHEIFPDEHGILSDGSVFFLAV